MFVFINRTMERNKKKADRQLEAEEEARMNEALMDEQEDEPPTKEQWCQPTFATRRFKDHKGKLASFECCFAHNITTVNQSGEVTYKITHEVGTQVEHEPDKDEFRFVDREVGTDPMAVCYQGYQSVVANGTLRQLTSVSQDHLELLLGLLYDLKPLKMTTEDHLLLDEYQSC